MLLQQVYDNLNMNPETSYNAVNILQEYIECEVSLIDDVYSKDLIKIESNYWLQKYNK